jgi:hypothetical protein
VPQIAWIHPPGVFSDVVSVYRKTVGPAPGGGGELTETWEAVAQDWPRSFVTPMSEADQLTLGERYRSANYFCYLMRQDDGTLPDVATDDHLTFTDRRGEIHTLNVSYSVDEGGAGVCLRCVCTELHEAS